MAPINWIFLFIIFIATYLLFNIMNYFIFIPKIKKTSLKSKKFKFLNWKW
uniref:ATP synthase F0 subunit 8 n=2 Tax=Culicoides arakawae TaxID=198116 RepID=A7VN29_CULAR|nr:ATP synthase F0 subunit 8 [Culicoides arakawae]